MNDNDDLTPDVARVRAARPDDASTGPRPIANNILQRVARQRAERRATPDEVWCERCDAPSVTIVETQSGEHALCAKHAADLKYTLTCPGFRRRD